MASARTANALAARAWIQSNRDQFLEPVLWSPNQVSFIVSTREDYERLCLIAMGEASHPLRTICIILQMGIQPRAGILSAADPADEEIARTMGKAQEQQSRKRTRDPPNGKETHPLLLPALDSNNWWPTNPRTPPSVERCTTAQAAAAAAANEWRCVRVCVCMCVCVYVFVFMCVCVCVCACV